MSTVTETDLKRLEDLIIASREENRQRFTALEAATTAIQKEVSDYRLNSPHQQHAHLGNSRWRTETVINLDYHHH